MAKYTVHIYAGEYKDRQKQANKDDCHIYLEQHVNSSTSDDADYAMAILNNYGASKLGSVKMGQWYAKKAGELFDVGGPNDHDVLANHGYGPGVRIGGRGSNNIANLNCPALLLEPWFASNSKQCQRFNNSQGVQLGAQLIRDLVRKFYPGGATIGLSAGHMGKPSAPNDRGAMMVNGVFDTEAGWANEVVRAAKALLEQHKNTEQKSELYTIAFDSALEIVETSIPNPNTIHIWAKRKPT